MQVLENIELRKKTTLRLGGTVPFFYEIRTESELFELAQIEQKKGLPIYLLGGGSNLLITDKSMGHSNDMLPFSVAQIQIRYEEEKFQDIFLWQDDKLAPPLAKKYIAQGITEKTLRAEVGAGFAMQKFIKLCAEKGCTGLEGLVGIPGKLGGAIAMNAGGYFCEMDQVLETVRIFHKQYGILNLTRENFNNSYRSFMAYHPENKEQLTDYIICGASFIFPVIAREQVKTKIQENLDYKKSTQPIKAFTAGCVFKNPNKEVRSLKHTCIEGNISAGKLLEEVGMKGKEYGGMRFSPLHANFLENMGNGDTKSALILIEKAIEAVYIHTDIKLEKEVKVWL